MTEILYFMSDIKYLKKSYEDRKEIIKDKLEYFKSIYNENDKRIFEELCFCLLTPQSKAKLCDKAIKNLVKTGYLFKGSQEDVKDYLIGVRFNNNKSKYILEARELFSNNGKFIIKGKLKEFNNSVELREWLVKNVKGMGLKESAHFLRNIGIYDNLAILDRHILRNLEKYNVIDKIPETLTNKKYFEIEEKFFKFSEKLGIPVEELDLLFWSEQTGEVFK